MKKNLLILPLAMLALLASCSNPSPSSSLPSSSNPSSSNEMSSSQEQKMEKTEMAYTYYDYGKGVASDIAYCPSIGSPKILVIPVWFTDSATYLPEEENKANVLEDISMAFFGSKEETGWHSISSYYNEESSGKLTFSGTVSDKWYEAAFSSSDVGALQVYTMGIVIDAVDEYFESHPEDDRKAYDLDGDGYLDAVSLIYAAPDRQALGDQTLTNLWAYCSWLSSLLSVPDVEKPSPCGYFWASYDFLYSEERATERAGTSYHNGSSTGFTSDTSVDAHTYIHEFGHILGLDDYYDVNGQYRPAGDFSMEDMNVGGHDPFSLMALGWANPYIPTESVSLTFGAFQTTKEFILLTPEWNSLNSPFDEYLIIELFTPTGLNELDTTYSYKGLRTQGTKETGIRLWHVDSRFVEVRVNEDQSVAYGELTSNPYPEGWKVYKAFPNTYYKEGGQNQYCSVLGEEYSDYNTLQLIRNDKNETYRPTLALEGEDLFKDGDSFSMKEYSSQFVKGENLNKDIPLGWSFSVSIKGEGENATATIDLVKE